MKPLRVRVNVRLLAAPSPTLARWIGACTHARASSDHTGNHSKHLLYKTNTFINVPVLAAVALTNLHTSPQRHTNTEE